MGSTVESRRVTYAVTEPIHVAPAHQVSEVPVPPAFLASVVVPATRYTRWGKRLFDLVGASLLLVVLAVPMLAIALTIRLTTDGNVFYTQTRLGWGLQRFQCLKFRTMVPNAEAILAQDDDLKRAMSANWKLPNDPRVTPVGRFLRPASLDELPQLFNVLKGEMSLVGPRPYLPSELADEFGVHADAITSTRPGMTGLWQVSGRSHLSPVDRIRLDEAYVSSYTFWGDLKLLVRTINVVFNRNGAY